METNQQKLHPNHKILLKLNENVMQNLFEILRYENLSFTAHCVIEIDFALN